MEKPISPSGAAKSTTPSMEPRIFGTSVGVGIPIKPNTVPITITKPVMKKQINALVCCTWNIRRGLIKREIELIDLLKSENVDGLYPKFYPIPEK